MSLPQGCTPWEVRFDLHHMMKRRQRDSVTAVIVVSRFRVAEAEAEAFRDHAELAHATLAACAGYLRGTVGRNVDDPQLWSIVTWWENVGSYRRALSSYDVKLHAVPLLSQAVDEPSAYETVLPGVELNVDRARSLD